MDKDLKNILIKMFRLGFFNYNLNLKSVRIKLYKLGISEKDISLRAKNW